MSEKREITLNILNNTCVWNAMRQDNCYGSFCVIMVIGQAPTLRSWASTFILLLSTRRPGSVLNWPPQVLQKNQWQLTMHGTAGNQTFQWWIHLSRYHACRLIPHCINMFSFLPNAIHITRLPQNRRWKNPNVMTPTGLPAAALPLAPIAYESGGAFRHALVVVDHKPLVFTRFGGGDFRAKLFCDAAPALELVRVGRAGGHADALVVVIAAGDARRVVVGRRAAPQALGMATLVLVRAGSLAARAGAHCKTESEQAWTRGTK